MWDTLATPGPARAAEYRAAGRWRDETFLDDLAAAARGRPDHPAVIAYEDGKSARTLTYADLAKMVARFAGALTELGVHRGDVVVPYLPNRWMLAPLYLACARVGAVAAPAQPALAGREVCAVVVPAGEPPTVQDLRDHLEREQVTPAATSPPSAAGRTPSACWPTPGGCGCCWPSTPSPVSASPIWRWRRG